MSTSPAIMIMANTQASSANAAAQDALRRSCEVSVKGYEHNSATVAQMLDYSKCIELLHPTGTDVFALWIKGLVILILLGTVIGSVLDKRERVFGGLAGATAGVLTWIIIVAVAFLFS